MTQPAAVSSVQLQVCECWSAAEQLLRRGYFPCAPKRPSLAFSIRLLEFISIHSLNVAPNITAWGASLQRFWARREQAFEHEVSSMRHNTNPYGTKSL